MNVRKIALALLEEYESAGKYANLSLSSHKTDGLTENERARLTALFYTAVEHKLTYKHFLGALSGRAPGDVSPHLSAILCLGFAELLDLGGVPDFAAVNEAVSLAGSAGEKSFVNGVLRALIRARDAGALPYPPREKNPARYLSVKYSFPLPTVKKFIGLFGEEKTEEILGKFNTDPRLTLAVNLSRTSREALVSSLRLAGYDALPTAFSPIGIRLSSSENPTKLPGFAEGHFFVQDEASQLCAAALLPCEAPARILDVCAAPGGKTFAVSSLFTGKPEVFAFDLHESKLSLIRSSAERLGFDRIAVAARDATEPDPALFESADAVFCDVPCSGLGVLGKKPDLRYKDLSETAPLPALQGKILRASASYVRPGGLLIYSTCTLDPAENEEVVKAFLAERGDFAPVDFSFGALRSDAGMLTLLPSDYDGFFIAKLKRKES